MLRRVDMWSTEGMFYQIYPLGFYGAPKENDGVLVPRIQKVVEWIPYLKRLHADTVYFSPVFESDRHGYDTRDYAKIDCRLGSNAGFAEACKTFKENRIYMVLDGVSNHVGHGFWAFQDVLQKWEQSQYKDWLYIHFNGNSNYNDGFWYEGWEGHFGLVKLNLDNPQVTDYLFSYIKARIEEFQIDGLRLDVAYCPNPNFMRKLRAFCDSVKLGFFLLGEILLGDYKCIVSPEMLHSCTNYKCYKGLYSSLNDLNLFEINYALNCQFGKESHAIHKGEHLFSFVDNHDVTRVASILREKRHLSLLYCPLFGMSDIPCIYYGSEWGVLGEKGHGSDDAFRPELTSPEWNELTDAIASPTEIRRSHKVLTYGDYKSIVLTNRQLVFQQEFEGERIWIDLNAEDKAYRAYFNGADAGMATDLSRGGQVPLSGGYQIPPFGYFIWRLS